MWVWLLVEMKDKIQIKMGVLKFIKWVVLDYVMNCPRVLSEIDALEYWY